MSRRSASKPKQKQKKSFLTLLRSSVILSAIDRFVQTIYGSLQNGLFGAALTAYPSPAPAGEAGLFRRSSAAIRRTVSQTVEQSCTTHIFHRFLQFLLKCRLRVYGAFILPFGIYAAASYLLGAVSESGLAPTLTLVTALFLIGVSLPLLSANVSLAQALRESRFAPALLSLLGVHRESLRIDGVAGRSNLALIAGMILGIASFIVQPIYIVLGLVGLFLAYRVLVTPELGVMALIFGMPFLPTMALAALVVYTALCLMIKLILGKRQLSLEAVDIAALAFAFSLFCSGVFSFSTGSLKPALLFICFLCAYFLTVTLIRTGEWLSRCLWSAIASATVVALIGIVQYFSGALSTKNAWLDSDMFEEIAGRAVSTLENPNMLAEYLILLLPLAAAQLLCRSGASQRVCAFFACCAMGACVILTWSRGAWLGLIFGALVFLLIWNRRSLYLILAGVASIPFLPLILPDAILQRFGSIGNLADTSTSYRVSIWRGTVHLLQDYWLTGIGVGEAAWKTVYPRYALASIETAPHAHNLYLQTWVQGGIVALCLLAAFLVLLLQCNFSYYRELKTMRTTLVDAALSPQLKADARTDKPKNKRSIEQRITAMRLEAAAPLCGILATLLQGFTEYTWYNYRVYLMFWLAAGLSAAYVRTGRAELARLRGFAAAEADQSRTTEAELELPLTGTSSPEKGKSNHA